MTLLCKQTVLFLFAYVDITSDRILFYRSSVRPPGDNKVTWNLTAGGVSDGYVKCKSANRCQDSV